jgi:ribosomal-protein-alanine N-acetyltransferase
VKLRTAQLADAPAMARAHAAAFHAGWRASEIAKLMRIAGGFGVVADDGEAGFILVFAVAGEAEILTLAVPPALRRQGVGRALLAAATGLAAEAGAESMFLEVAEDNAAARALYLGAGFVVAGRRRDYYALADGTRSDALVLRLDLNSGRP